MLLAVLAGATGGAAADTLAFEQGQNGYEAMTDTSLYEDRTDNTNGGHAYLYAGRTKIGAGRRALLRFDLGTTIPRGAVIESVSLRLTVDQARPTTEPYTLHRVVREWGEGTADSGDPGGLGTPANPGDATWNSARHLQQLWSLPGGDFEPTTSSLAMVPGTLGAVVDFTGSGLAADVESWLADPTRNYGWILRGNETAVYNAHRFVSSEGTAGKRPRLTITYSVPVTAASEWQLYH